jgi:hypothetical protein
MAGAGVLDDDAMLGAGPFGDPNAGKVGRLAVTAEGAIVDGAVAALVLVGAAKTAAVDGFSCGRTLEKKISFTVGLALALPPSTDDAELAALLAAAEGTAGLLMAMGMGPAGLVNGIEACKVEVDEGDAPSTAADAAEPSRCRYVARSSRSNSSSSSLFPAGGGAVPAVADAVVAAAPPAANEAAGGASAAAVAAAVEVFRARLGNLPVAIYTKASSKYS